MEDERRAWPIVVGGCLRSGTSLVRRLLNAHSRIHCPPEVKFFRDFYGEYLHDPLAHLRFTATARSLLSEAALLEVLGRAFVELHERAATAAGKARWADKNPENVLHVVDWDALLGKRWLFVHVVRNPLDTLASMIEAGFPLTVPPDLEGRIDLYRSHVAAGLARVLAEPGRSVQVLYEDLVDDCQTTLGGLMAWLGEELEPAQLSFNDVEHGRGLEDPKVALTKEIHSDSLGRWKRALTDAEATQIIQSTAGLWEQADREGRWPLPSTRARR